MIGGQAMLLRTWKASTPENQKDLKTKLEVHLSKWSNLKIKSDLVQPLLLQASQDVVAGKAKKGVQGGDMASQAAQAEAGAAGVVASAAAAAEAAPAKAVRKKK